MHALVLDTVETITQCNQSEGYEIGDVKLIFKNTHDDEENGKPKKYTINAKSVMAPDVFYVVHFNVDLDQIANCTCQEPDFCKCQNYEEVVGSFVDALSDYLQESQTLDNDDLMSVNADQNETSDNEPEEKKRRTWVKTLLH